MINIVGHGILDSQYLAEGCLKGLQIRIREKMNPISGMGQRE